MDERPLGPGERGCGEGLISARLVVVLTLTVCLYFVLRLVYFVIAINHSIPPDEVTHLNRVEYFAQFFLLPSGRPGAEDSHLWISRYHPALYYFLAGKFLVLDFFGVGSLEWTRLFSVVLSCLTLIYAWRFIRALSASTVVHLLFMVMLTNTLMFSFLSATVNYDPLVNLTAAAAFFYLDAYLRAKSPRALACLLISLLLGTLAKTTMLPFSFAVVIALLIHEGRVLKVRYAEFREECVACSLPSKLVYISALLLIGLNVLLYGSNIVRFGHLVPRVEQVLNDSELRSHTIGAREAIYLGFIQGELTMEEATEKAKAIDDPASTADTVNLLRYAHWRMENEGPFVPVSRFSYAIPWFKLMAYSIFGLMGHSVLYKSFWEHLPYLLTFGAAGVFFALRSFQRRVPAREFLYAGMFLFYVLLLMQVVNYSTYLTFQLQHLGVQGRYLFLFIVPIYGITAKYLLSFGSPRIQLVLAVVVMLFFAYGDFPYFLTNWGDGPW